jgi:hypothetical protein
MEITNPFPNGHCPMAGGNLEIILEVEKMSYGKTRHREHLNQQIVK